MAEKGNPAICDKIHGPWGDIMLSKINQAGKDK